jgi:GNAT superfamily N-acetyltransferase
MKTLDLPLDPTARLDGDPAIVHVRAIRSSDAAELERFYRDLSAECRRTRFFSISPGLSHTQSISFCMTDHDHREGFVAVAIRGPGGSERIVGHLCLEPDGSTAAEVSIAVADEFQHHGVGRLLIAEGVAWARDEHIASLTATMLAGNAPIHRLLVGLGLPYRLSYVGAGLAEITIDLVPQSVAASLGLVALMAISPAVAAEVVRSTRRAVWVA